MESSQVGVVCQTVGPFSGAVGECIGQASADDFKLDQIQKYLDQMQKQFAKLGVALDGHDVDSHNPTHTRRIIELLGPIGKARTFMSNLLLSRDNDRLKEIFGNDDCMLIAMLRATTQDTKNILTSTPFAGDERISHCLEACESVESVLKDRFRLEQKLKYAHEHVNDMRSADRIMLLTEIDEAEDPREAIEALWHTFDVIRAGALSGDAFQSVIEVLCQYVSEESRQLSIAKNLPMLHHLPDSAVLRELVIKHMDPDGDGNITKDEFTVGVQRVVDDIDPPDRRVSNLEDLRKTNLEKLWNEIDTAGAGAVHGDSVNSVIDHFCKFVSNQSSERMDRLRNEMGPEKAAKLSRLHHTADSPILRDLVKQFMDPNNDGSIDRVEFLEGAIRVMDDIESSIHRKTVLDQRRVVKN